jgi:predicted nucleic acid-binding protein
MPVFEENRDVLSRKENKVQLNLTDSKLNTILQFIAAVGHPTKISYLWRPNLRDEADNMVFEFAIASSSQYLTTIQIRENKSDADLRYFG